MLGRLVFGAVLVGAAALVLSSLQDVERYLRIRDM